jgi:hypothetical protein
MRHVAIGGSINCRSPESEHIRGQSPTVGIGQPAGRHRRAPDSVLDRIEDLRGGPAAIPLPRSGESRTDVGADAIRAMTGRATLVKGVPRFGDGLFVSDELLCLGGERGAATLRVAGKSSACYQSG